jgi:hypothetical protein
MLLVVKNKKINAAVPHKQTQNQPWEMAYFLNNYSGRLV